MIKFLRWLPKWQNSLIYIFLLAVSYLLYANLGRDPLFDWDEGIYAGLGSGLLTQATFFTSQWNGAPWFEKPPGIAWLSGLGMALAGTNELGARLLMPLLAVYVLYIVYRIGTKLGSWRHGLIAAGILATFNLFLGRTRALNTDMPLLAGLSTTVLFLLENKRPLYPALAICASIWFKGPAGLLAALIPLPLLLAKTRSYVLRVTCYVLLFALPWHLYSYLRYGQEFLTPYLFEQVLRRATAPIEFHLESRWFYFNYLFENLGLGVLLVAGLGAAVIIWQYWRNSRVTFNLLRVTLLWWLLFPLALFTLAKTRLFWYILPVYPALALLVSEAIGRFATDSRSRTVVAILAVGIAMQGLLVTSRSVELTRTSAPLSDRLTVASALAGSSRPLSVLVPPTERLAEAVLPANLRLSSSFRYGGMPSVPFYYRGLVQFFYNVDEFRLYWESTPAPLALLTRDDLDKLSSYHLVVETPTYVGIEKGLYAHR